MKSLSIRNLVAGLAVTAFTVLSVIGCASEAAPEPAPSVSDTSTNAAPQLARAEAEMADCSGCLDNNRQICCRGSVCWETAC